MDNRQLALRHIFCALRESRNSKDLIDLVLNEETDTIRCIYSDGHQKNLILDAATIEEMMKVLANEV